MTELYRNIIGQPTKTAKIISEVTYMMSGVMLEWNVSARLGWKESD